MEKEDFIVNIRCGIKYCANVLKLECDPKGTTDCAGQYGWKYVLTWEPIYKSDSAPYICDECWEQSGLKWREN